MKMKISLILHWLLGLAMIVFGLNKFVGFMAPPELPAAAGAFMGALIETGYMLPLIGGTEVVGGVLLLIAKLRPVGLVILLPISVNIILFHAFLAPAGGVPAYALGAINFYLLTTHCSKFKSAL
jgi:putative oxidoreductase